MGVIYTARDSRIGSGNVGFASNSSTSLAPCSGALPLAPVEKSEAPPCHLPILESLSVYVRKIAFLSLFFGAALFAEEEVERFSEAMGHMIGKNFQSMGLKVDLEALLRGIEAEAKGEKSPLEEEECIEWMAAYQQEHLGKLAAENLAKAQTFLAENQKRQEIRTLEGGKLQYEIVQEGKGEAVQSYNTPLVRLKGRFQDGELIGEMEESLALDRAISGISLGLVGMRSGEKRILYVHPDLGFPDQRGAEAGSLLVFEVEVLQADVSSSAGASDEAEEGARLLKSPDELELPKEAIDAAGL